MSFVIIAHSLFLCFLVLIAWQLRMFLLVFGLKSVVGASRWSQSHLWTWSSLGCWCRWSFPFRSHHWFWSMVGRWFANHQGLVWRSSLTWPAISVRDSLWLLLWTLNNWLAGLGWRCECWWSRIHPGVVPCMSSSCWRTMGCFASPDSCPYSRSGACHKEHAAALRLCSHLLPKSCQSWAETHSRRG